MNESLIHFLEFFFSLCITSCMIRLPFSVTVGLGGGGVRTGVFCYLPSLEYIWEDEEEEGAVLS